MSSKKPHPKGGKQRKASGLPDRKKPSSPTSKSGDMLFSWAPLVFLVLSALVFLQARIKLLAIPLERDEGSFAYIGHWLMRGGTMYTDMLDSKLPGLYSYYGLMTTVFGLSATGVHIGLLLANIASAICLFFLVKNLYNQLTACIATSLFLFLVISFNVVGFAAHATQLLTPFVLGGIWAFWRGVHSGKLLLFFIAGLLIGIAFSIKQQAAIYGLLLAVLWWPARMKWYTLDKGRLPMKEWLLLGFGGFLPVVLIVSYFAIVGRLDEFMNWTVTQPLHLAGSFNISRYDLFMNALPGVLKQFEGVWILAGAGLMLIFKSGFKREGPWFGLFFSLLGVISIVIGVAFYSHYYVIAMPGIALLAACTLNWISQKIKVYGSALSLVLASTLIILSIQGRSDYYFNPDYAKIHFQAYGQNMFPELEKIGKALSLRVPKGQRIGIMGSEPEVLVAAGRESCSRHLMVYSLLSDPELSPPLQQEYIKEMQDCAPEYMVWNAVSSSWTSGYDQLRFFKQFMVWVEANYEVTGIAESRGPNPGIIVWDEALKTHQSISDNKVYILKKKSG